MKQVEESNSSSEKKKVVEKETYMKKELAVLYGLSDRAFHTLFKPHEEYVGKKEGRYYSVAQKQRIWNRLGKPSCLLDDEYVPANSTKAA